jgi:Porin subfamily
MGPVKRVLLGSAAGVFAVAGAQAADLPVKAKPVEYVKVCSLYGAGFWYVPGTDTCIKIGAFVKLQTAYHANQGGPFMMGVAANGAGDTGGQQTRTGSAQFSFNNRAAVSFDMRTQTEYGTLRSYFDAFFQTQSNSGATQLSSIVLGNTRAFIQFAGFTAGRMRSFFDMYFQGTYAFSGSRFGNDSSPNGIIGAAYTWQFGGGLSASLSLEDNGQGNAGRGRSTVDASLVNALTVGGNTFNDKGQEFFDPVANLRLDQQWGFVGVSGALHDASGGYYQGTNVSTAANGVQTNVAGPLLEGNGHPGDKFGWAATAAFLVNNPFGLPGDTIAGQAVYSKGAAGYATAAWGPTAVFGAGKNLGLGFMEEGIFTTGSNVELTTVWSFNAAYEHRWNPQWRTSVYGGMFGVQYDGTAKAAICAMPLTGPPITATLSNGGVSNCNPNFSMSGLGSRTIWNPVPDLDIGFDVVWWHLNTAFGGGTLNLAAPAGAKPAGTYTVSDQDAVSAIFRIQRNFLY